MHKKWNANTAILSEMLVIEAYRYIAQVNEKHLPEILNLFSTTAMEICQGQQHDMDFEQRTDVAEKYLEMIRLKTAVLIGARLR